MKLSKELKRKTARKQLSEEQKSSRNGAREKNYRGSLVPVVGQYLYSDSLAKTPKFGRKPRQAKSSLFLR